MKLCILATSGGGITLENNWLTFKPRRCTIQNRCKFVKACSSFNNPGGTQLFRLDFRRPLGSGFLPRGEGGEEGVSVGLFSWTAAGNQLFITVDIFSEGFDHLQKNWDLVLKEIWSFLRQDVSLKIRNTGN